MRKKERMELVGKVVDGRYLILRLIDVGGTGVVFEAEHVVTGENVVIKAMRPIYAHNPDLRRRLRREAEVARSVHHRGIVPVIDEGALPDGSPYIVMERIRGVSLSRLLLRVGRLSAAETAAIAIRVASILHAAHGAGYVHRDIKPEHIILKEGDNGELFVWLLDFGVCASKTAPRDEKDREHGRVFGTPTYCSPEQAAGIPEVDGRADLFSLAVTMYECLAGRVPFTGRDVNDLLRRIIRRDAAPIGEIMPAFKEGIGEQIDLAMARVPTDRHTTARAFARSLVPFAGQRIDTERKVLERLGVGVTATLTENSPTVEVTSPTGIVAA